MDRLPRIPYVHISGDLSLMGLVLPRTSLAAADRHSDDPRIPPPRISLADSANGFPGYLLKLLWSAATKHGRRGTASKRES
jgi:hypothetical protein